MKGILIEKGLEFCKVVDFEDNLEQLYKLTDCDCIDIVERQVGGIYYDVVCDDEGLLKENPIVTAYNDKDEPMLVGNLLFCHNDEEGNLSGLSDEDIENIISHVHNSMMISGRKIVLTGVVRGVEY